MSSHAVTRLTIVRASGRFSARIPSTVGVEVVELVGGVAVGAELPRADRREVARVEGEDDPARRDSRRAGRCGRPCRRARTPAPRSPTSILDMPGERSAVAAHPAGVRPASIVTLSIVTTWVGCSVGSPELADRLDHVVALAHLAEHRVVGRQAGVGGRGDDEELAARARRAARPRSSPSPPARSCRSVSCGGGSVHRVAGPAVPLPVGSPPWITKPGAIRWKIVPS